MVASRVCHERQRLLAFLVDRLEVRLDRVKRSTVLERAGLLQVLALRSFRVSPGSGSRRQDEVTISGYLEEESQLRLLLRACRRSVQRAAREHWRAVREALEARGRRADGRKRDGRWWRHGEMFSCS